MNRQAFLYTLITGVLSSVVFFFIWGMEFNFGFDFLWKFYIGYLLGIILHEALHAFGFILFGEAKMTEIKFGIMWKYIAPYAHCKVPLTIKAYRIALLLPVILTVIIPLILALIIGNGLLLFISVLLTAGGIGDWIIFRRIKTFPGNALLEDHPTKIGCIIYEEGRSSTLV